MAYFTKEVIFKMQKPKNFCTSGIGKDDVHVPTRTPLSLSLSVDLSALIWKSKRALMSSIPFCFKEYYFPKPNQFFFDNFHEMYIKFSHEILVKIEHSMLIWDFM
jgi:hypothetical protein